MVYASVIRFSDTGINLKLTTLNPLQKKPHWPPSLRGYKHCQEEWHHKLKVSTWHQSAPHLNLIELHVTQVFANLRDSSPTDKESMSVRNLTMLHAWVMQHLQVREFHIVIMLDGSVCGVTSRKYRLLNSTQKYHALLKVQGRVC